MGPFHWVSHIDGREGSHQVEILSTQDISFSYPGEEKGALNHITFSVEKGEFIVLCGSSGSGKSTLLQLLKTDIAPHGEMKGKIFYKSSSMENHTRLVRAKEIGMVFQNPDNQIVMDTVMDELLFGLENLGFSTGEMRKKVAEMVHFFDLGHLLEKKTDELSGGQKQLINLASVLLLDPDILLLDEPTGQLDPIAAKEFISTLARLNDEFGITIIIAEHRLEELFSIADKVMVLEQGNLIYFSDTKKVVGELANDETWRNYLPNATQLYLTYNSKVNEKEIPLNVKEAKQWLEQQSILESRTSYKFIEKEDKTILELKEIDFQYDPYSPMVLNNLSISFREKEIHAILGANGTGKSTLLKIINGILKPQHGKLKLDGKKQKKMDPRIIGYLPQNPELFFLQDSLWEEYMMITKAFEMPNAEDYTTQLLKKFNLESFKYRHPYDLSGGQLQKAALIGTLLLNPRILLIDEPTKGLDPDSKAQLEQLLRRLTQENGMTIIMVTHDVEFAATCADQCSMIFQGQITITEKTRDFFQGNMYYTTVMNRITRKLDVPQVITIKEAKEKWLVQNKS